MNKYKRHPGEPGERFWKKVTKTETCWLWNACCMNRNGYGVFASVKELAHRYSYRLAFGEIPKGMYVCHHCDNPKCVRPDHLFLGTQRDNLHDMRRKGRDMDSVCPHLHARGSRAAGALLNEKNVFQLRRLHLFKGCSSLRIARWVKMDPAGIVRMLKGENWGHVPFPKSATDIFVG